MPTETSRTKAREAARLLAKRKIRERLLSCLIATAPQTPYYIGTHTRAIAGLLERATKAVEAGGRFYAVISTPPRHGKSDLVARRFPAWYLMNHPAHEIILATYSGELSGDLSFDARKCFAALAPLSATHGLSLQEDRKKLAAWKTSEGGSFFAVGFGGAVTGRGADVLLIDDFCRNREDAESVILRRRTWEAFQNDLMTRLAPAHAVIVQGTRWHEDDLIGRIVKEMKEGDAAFPHFEFLNFPAWDDARGWLFPERFPPEFYETQKAVNSKYSWAALWQGDPRPRTGNILRGDLMRIVDAPPPGVAWVRGWDLASTAKERAKDDPDYSVGLKLGFAGARLVIADIKRGQWEAGRRHDMIIGTAESDGSAVTVGVEAVAGYKDAFTEIRDALAGRAPVRKVVPARDLVSRCAPLEIIFEDARVDMVRAPWNDGFRDEIVSFPYGGHDDQIAAMLTAFETLRKRGSGTAIGRL